MLESFFKIVRDQLEETEEGSQILEKIFGKILKKISLITKHLTSPMPLS
jgi:hypothetical protein